MVRSLLAILVGAVAGCRAQPAVQSLIAIDPIVRLEIVTETGARWRQSGVVVADGHVLTPMWHPPRATLVFAHTSDGAKGSSEGIAGYHFDGKLLLLRVNWGDHKPASLTVAHETPRSFTKLKCVSVGNGFGDQRCEDTVQVAAHRQVCAYHVSLPAQRAAPLTGSVLLDDEGCVAGVVSRMCLGLAFLNSPDLPLPMINAHVVRPEIALALKAGGLITWEQWCTERYAQLEASEEAAERVLGLLSERRFTDAWDEAVRSRDLDDRSGKSWFAVGTVRQALQKWQDASDAYAKAAELTPTNAHIFAAWACMLARTGRVEEAIAVAEKAVVLAPTSAYVHASKADVLTCAHRCDEALASYDEALKRDPENQGYRSNRTTLAEWMVRNNLERLRENAK